MNKCHTKAAFLPMSPFLIVDTFSTLLIEMQHFGVIYIWIILKQKSVIIYLTELPKNHGNLLRPVSY